MATVTNPETVPVVDEALVRDAVDSVMPMVETMVEEVDTDAVMANMQAIATTDAGMAEEIVEGENVVMGIDERIVQDEVGALTETGNQVGVAVLERSEMPGYYAWVWWLVGGVALIVAVVAIVLLSKGKKKNKTESTEEVAE